MVRVLRCVFVGLIFSVLSLHAQASMDYPHSEVNGINCLTCHDLHGGFSKLLRIANPHPPQDIDDTPANNLCWSCHNNIVAPFKNPHSSEQIDEDYGQWAVECIVCHNPHKQEQKYYYGSQGYLATGTVTTVTTTSLYSAGAAWTVDEFADLIVVPNVAEQYNNYRIVSNTADTLTISAGLSGNGMDMSLVSPGNTFAIIYGKLIYGPNRLSRPDRGSPDNLPASDTCSVTANVFSCTNRINTTVKFLRDFRDGVGGSNEHSFAGDVDGDGLYQGPCEVCHTRTKHHRNNNDFPGDADHTHNVGLKCTLCHKHENGFLPLGAGAHDVHITKEFGPKITCSDGDWGCHGTFVPGSNYPNEVIFADGLALCDGRPGTPCPNIGSDTGTQVCANCHGEGSLLAKYYFFRPGSSEGDPGLWITPQSGAYTWGDTWLGDIGEAKYCGSCHNDTDSTFVPGPQPPGQPPNIAGDLNLDTGVSTYGFFFNGHGKPTGNYPRLSWQNDTETGNPAANKVCSDCHEYTGTHFNNPDPDNKRLKAGYENDAASTVCDKCHGQEGGDTATADPKYYTTHAAYENSAHGADSKSNLKCTDCHDPHGAANQDVATNGEPNQAMTKGYKQALCFRCHSDSGDLMNVQNFAVSGHKGTHDGANDQAVLSDADGSFDDVTDMTTNATWTVFNLTDGSSGTLTGHDKTLMQITAALSGGTDNDWDTGDKYHIVYQSGGQPVDDIQHALTQANIHNMGWDYSISGKNYKLNCVSCHNVHLVTGQFWEADQLKSPITRISTPSSPEGNLNVWGDVAGETMDNYGGTYVQPKGEEFTGAQLPTYPQFCLDCHSSMVESQGHGGIDWNGDPHGLQSANQPNGYGTCPNWWGCGKASGWDGDDCVDPDKCWPVISRGKGDILFSRQPFDHAQRIAGANFALSCTNCHEPHGSNNSSMIRPNPNGGTGTIIWNTMCNNCHYYYSDWHAGMSCGDASCHTTTKIHRMANKTGSQGTRTFDPDMPLYLKFDGNLKDSSQTWQMDSQWYNGGTGNGSFVGGKVGSAIQLGVDQGVQVGTENASWSTDAGAHGTHIYTEMKFNTSQEIWVYPMGDDTSEYTIFAKHVGYANGGYAFTLEPAGLTPGLKAVFNIKSDTNGTAQDGRSSIRGAYSSVAIPLNTWTHVAATFDTAGPGRDPNDQSVGRIRIYVNGEDKTTSDTVGDNMQPEANETSIFAFPENNGWNQVGVCYNDDWCAGEFAVGGFPWQADFIGRLDEAKIWNITKDAAYFSSNDALAGPYISLVEGVIGSNQLTVTFSEGVYTTTGSTGDLVPADFVITDTDNSRTITGVTHTAGSDTAVVTLSSVLDATDDMHVDTLAPASNAIYDDKDVTASTTAAAFKPSSACPSSPVIFDLNEAPGSAYVFDDQGMLPGEVFGDASTLTGSVLDGNGTDRYAIFNYNSGCIQVDDAMTLEARIKPTGLTGSGTATYVERIFARDGGGLFQMSLWRNNTWVNYNAPADEASIALWVRPDDPHGGNAWKVMLTNYTGAATGGENDCKLVDNHWYQIKVRWDTDSVNPSTIGIPGSIYIDDQGTDGAGAGENWAGYIDCTDTDMSLVENDLYRFYTDDTMYGVISNFAIGVNSGNQTKHHFNGEIDWVIWKDTVDATP